MKAVAKVIKAEHGSNRLKVSINKKLDDYAQRNLFPEKLEKVNAIVSNLQLSFKK